MIDSTLGNLKNYLIVNLTTLKPLIFGEILNKGVKFSRCSLQVTRIADCSRVYKLFAVRDVCI